MSMLIFAKINLSYVIERFKVKRKDSYVTLLGYIIKWKMYHFV